MHTVATYSGNYKKEYGGTGFLDENELFKNCFAPSLSTAEYQKNSYFYKTEHGAYIGDMFISIIHTCELNKVNPFDYLSSLLNNYQNVKTNPSAWLPWNYSKEAETK